MITKIINRIRFKRLLKMRLSVWCRNGEVCVEAQHCEDLECKYKRKKNDIISGCLKCRQFQITSPSDLWFIANHMYFETGSVKQDFE